MSMLHLSRAMCGTLVSGGSGFSFGNAALGGNAPQGVGYRLPVDITTDGTYDFTAGPEFHFFEDGSGVTIGAAISTGTTQFTSVTGSLTAQADDTASGRSFRISNGVNTFAGQGSIDSGITALGIFNSVIYKTTTQYFLNTVTPNTFPGNAVQKTTWYFPLANGVGGQEGTNDLIFDNYGGQWKVFDSNDISDTYAADWTPNISPAPAGHFSWNGPNLWSTWIQADLVAPLTNNSKAWKEIRHWEGAGYIGQKSWDPLPASFSDSTPEPIFTGTSDTNTMYWRHVNVPGWIGNFSGNHTAFDPRLADIFIQMSDSGLEAVRFAITNQSTFTASGPAAYLAWNYDDYATPWTTNTAHLLITSGYVNLSAPTWIHWIDETNTVIATRTFTT
jgi:hypothetical protein